MVNIFITGATGYIGGEALYQLSSTISRDHKISALVRSSEHAEKLGGAFPDVRIVLGDLNDSDLVQKEAEQADVVLNLAATNHVTSANAIINGFQKSAKHAFWIQISGGTLFAQDEIVNKRFGEETKKSYDDLDGIAEILSTITSNPQRTVDNLIISQNPSEIKTALVIGPLIYGTGRGPVNIRSVQAPEIARVTLKLGQGFVLGAGRNTWSNIHVHDLGSLFVKLVQAAILQREEGLWNKDGIYTPENGAKRFSQLHADVAKEAAELGFIPKGTDTKIITPEEADELSSDASILWGTNDAQKSSRAQKSLNWDPIGPSLEQELPAIIRAEHQA